MSNEFSLHSALVCPQGAWWSPIPRQEKVWISIAFAWCILLFAMMPIWHLRGGQNPSGIRGKTTPMAYLERVQKFIAEHQLLDDKGQPVIEGGFPVVAPPPGSHVYLMAQMWSWWPVLHLKKDAQYILHLSSFDVNHGFNLHPLNLNFQVVPGYDYGLKITPHATGDLRIVCNEFCGIGHHRMVGKIVVQD